MTKPTPPSASAIHAIVRRVLAEHLGNKQAPAPLSQSPYDLFHSAPVEELKAQIVAAGKRLWQRQYVDGNGGNISARITNELVLCTPTLCSKGELLASDLSIVDMENRQVYGIRPQTSEIRMHLEIYRTVPQARGVIHCHPPYATAHAVAGVIPPGNLIPEQEVFVGPVALAQYETPGTKEFAESVLPFVRNHNTVLLANHGIVCWADSVTHAGWYVEVVETYCKTIMIASQLRSPLAEIPPEKILDLLETKKKLGLPDARFPNQQAAEPRREASQANSSPRLQDVNADEFAAALTGRILEFLEARA